MRVKVHRQIKEFRLLALFAVLNAIAAAGLTATVSSHTSWTTLLCFVNTSAAAVYINTMAASYSSSYFEYVDKSTKNSMRVLVTFSVLSMLALMVTGVLMSLAAIDKGDPWLYAAAVFICLAAAMVFTLTSIFSISSAMVASFRCANSITFKDDEQLQLLASLHSSSLRFAYFKVPLEVNEDTGTLEPVYRPLLGYSKI